MKIIPALVVPILFLVSCQTKSKTDAVSITSLNLKRGEIVSCGPQDGEIYGMVSFRATVPAKLQKDFNIAIAMLHSFEYDEAEKKFASIIDQDPGCVMAYWGVAMSNFHPLWFPPTSDELKKGNEVVAIARQIKNKTRRESDYIEAISQFYTDADKLEHKARVLKFEKAMEEIYKTYPDDIEAAIFYTLALDAAASPSDRTFANQRKGFEILKPIFDEFPLHPGVAHYIIHNCDNPELAELGLNAARKYASIAPASAHAQHMPSHIFTRLGLWNECISSNLVSMASAQCYTQKANIKAHWDDELHAMDYLVYGYIQKGDDAKAKQQVDYLESITNVYPENSKAAYAFAAIPARYALEKKDWKAAASLQLHPQNFPWKNFPWQEGIIHFAKLIGYTHLNQLDSAEHELGTLRSLYEISQTQRNRNDEAPQLFVQIKAGEGLIELKKGNTDKALELMQSAADLEDGMEKHPVTPGAVIPARELFGEVLMELNKPSLAFDALQQNQKLHPYRKNGISDLSIAADRSGHKLEIKLPE